MKQFHSFLAAAAATFVLIAVLGDSSSPIVSESSMSSRRLSLPDEGVDVVVFLDVDGVLAPWPEEDSDREGDNADEDDDDPYVQICYNAVTSARLGALSELLKHIPSNRRKLILSSAWRNRKECEELLLRYFQEYGQAHHKSPLKHIEAFDGRTGPHQASRQKEIAEWIKENKQYMENTAWVVLDDLSSVIEEEEYKEVFIEHSVITDGKVGLTHAETEQALKLLQQQLEGPDS
jgi:HAD domain in Swiss Army Knife RNA repair proteins